MEDFDPTKGKDNQFALGAAIGGGANLAGAGALVAKAAAVKAAGAGALKAGALIALSNPVVGGIMLFGGLAYLGFKAFKKK